MKYRNDHFFDAKAGHARPASKGRKGGGNLPVRGFLVRSTALLTALCLSAAALPFPAAAAEKKKKKDGIYSEAIFSSDGLEDYNAEIAYNKKQPVQTNQIEGWPKGPVIGAAGAVVMDADSGAILYGKNVDKRLYPASITKVLTALLAYENLRPSDKITFSENAVFGIEAGSSNIGMDVGETITMEEALYGLLIASANEVAVALGEKVSGSESEFADLMNKRAKELGCQNSHFVNPNGLPDPDHYTSARDMALIAREVYKHPDLVHYMSQMNYHFEQSSKQPDDFWVLNTNDFLTGEVKCDDIVGGKTGYTDQARETLVSFAERDGVRLVCVIMREEPPYQYYDTIDLLDYAFKNFKTVRVAEEEKRFSMQSPDFLAKGPDIFGITASPCRIPEDTSLMIPKKASFADLTAQITPFTYEVPAATQESEKEKKEEADQGKDPSVGTGSTAAGTEAAAASGTDSAAASENESPESDAPAASTPGEDPSHLLEDGTRILGVIQYKYRDYDIGTANVLFRPSQKAVFSTKTTAGADTASDTASTGATASPEESTASSGSPSEGGSDSVTEEIHGIRSLLFGIAHTGAHGSIYLNILLILPLVLAIAFLLCVIFFIRSIIEERKRQSRRRRRRAGTNQGSGPAGSAGRRPSSSTGRREGRRESSYDRTGNRRYR